MPLKYLQAVQAYLFIIFIIRGNTTTHSLTALEEKKEIEKHLIGYHRNERTNKKKYLLH